MISACLGLLIGGVAAQAAADAHKVLHWVFSAAETGFDPARIHDYYSGCVTENIFEPLLTYDYLARPARLVAQTAQSLPRIDDAGKTYTFTLKHDIYFAPDSAFKNVRRELIATDYAYTIKRLMDPAIRSPWRFLVEGKIVGLDKLSREAEATGKFDYDAPIPGLRVTDRYTLAIRLTGADFNFAHILATPTFGAVAREVIEAYPQNTDAHPVGTGPYRLREWVRSSKIILDANPEYRGFVWNFQAGLDSEDSAIVLSMKGKSMPQIGVVEISIMEEDQSRWLAFQKGQLDVLNMEGPLAPQALQGASLKPELAGRGVKLSRMIDPEIVYTYWNMHDPVVGGTTKDKVALRRAMAMSYRIEDDIKVIRHQQASAEDYPIPAGVVGHDAAYRSVNAYNPYAANALLDRFGYERGANGWRKLPNGGDLAIHYATRPDSLGRQQEELWKKSLDAIGVRMETQRMPFSELLKAEKQCKLQMRTAAWVADYPDGDNFMQLLYGPNIHQSNNGCVALDDFDRVYEQSRSMAESPQRQHLYRQLARIIDVYGAWKVHLSRFRNMLVQPRVLGYKKHPILHAEWAYIDLDTRPIK